MKNIILLGSSGSLGNSFINDPNTKKYKLFIDKEYEIQKLMSYSFLSENNIDTVINCIGCIDKESLFFHSNYFVPSYIVEKLVQFTKISTNKIKFIHLSSLGVNDPYTNNSLEPIKLNITNRKPLKYNKYELTKSCADILIKDRLGNISNIELIILQPSTIIKPNSRFLKKLACFLFLFPLKITNISRLPITRIEKLILVMVEIIDNSEDVNKKYYYPGTYVFQVFERVDIYRLFPNYKYVSWIKIPISKRLMLYLVNRIPGFFPLSSFARIIKFLYFL